MGVSTVGGHLLCEGADDLSGDVQEKDGADKGQRQDEDNEGVAVTVEIQPQGRWREKRD